MVEAVVDYYALGLDGSKSFDELRRQIRRFLEKFNNQTKNAAPGSDAAAAAMKMKEVWGKALELFKTEEGRKAYDRELQAWKSSAQAKRMAEAAERGDADLGGAAETVLELVRRARAALNDGRLAVASRLAEQAIDADPRNWEAFFISGVAACRQDDYDEARVALRRAARLNDQNALIHGCLGELFERQKMWKESYENYAQAIALDPNDLDFRVAIGLVCVKAEAPDAGMRYLREALDKDPDNQGVKWALGVALAESARLNWTEIGEGHPRVEAGWWAMSRDQAMQAVRKLHEANLLGVSDPDLAKELAEIKRDVDRTVKRKFTGAWPLLGIITLIGGLSLYGGSAGGLLVLLFAAGYYTVNLVPQYAINARVLAGDSRMKQGFMNWYEGLENQLLKVAVSLMMLFALPLFMVFWAIRNWTGSNAPLGKELQDVRVPVVKPPTASAATATPTEPAQDSSPSGTPHSASEPAMARATSEAAESPNAAAPVVVSVSPATTSASTREPAFAPDSVVPPAPLPDAAPVRARRPTVPLFAILKRKAALYVLLGLLCVAVIAFALKLVTRHGESLSDSIASDFAKGVPAPLPKIGDVYVVQTVDQENSTLNNLVERKTVAVSGSGYEMSYTNLKTHYIRMLSFDSEGNVYRSRTNSGNGVDYSPSVRYFRFPMKIGDKWSQRSVESNVKTGVLRQMQIDATVARAEAISVPGATCRAMVIVSETKLYEGDDLHLASSGTDTSWYCPDVKRSVKSELESTDMAGVKSHKTAELVSYSLQ